MTLNVREDEAEGILDGSSVVESQDYTDTKKYSITASEQRWIDNLSDISDKAAKIL